MKGVGQKDDQREGMPSREAGNGGGRDMQAAWEARLQPLSQLSKTKDVHAPMRGQRV